MLSKRMVWVCLVALLAFGCVSPEEREKAIRSANPQWSEDTIRKVASRRLEPGMSREMVLASLGKPDRVSKEGGEEVWGYAVPEVGDSARYQRFVYFVHLKNGSVIRTEGEVEQVPVPLL
jgi:hypothetical protein